MYNRQFFATPLGKAALASIAAMTAMIALSSQLAFDINPAALATPSVESGFDTALSVELA